MALLRSLLDSAAKDYVRSVVFIDDEIYSAPPENRPMGEQGQLENFKSLSSQFETNATDPSDDTPIEIEQDDRTSEPNYFNPREIISSFAQQGIVCGIYEPQEGFSSDVNSELFNLCKRTDILILDWEMFGDGGYSSRNLIKNLLTFSKNSNPYQLSLIVIYTLHPNLFRIVDLLTQDLEKVGINCVASEHTIDALASRIAVMGKPGAVGRNELDKQKEVREMNLASAILSEFIEAYNGLLPTFALKAMASIRKNSKRVMDKFNRTLDGPFLLHRALILSSEEAFQQLPELIADELRAVIEDDQYPIEEFPKIAQEASCSIKLNRPDISWKRKGGQGEEIDAIPIVQRFLTGGVKAIGEDAKVCKEAHDIHSRTSLKPSEIAKLTMIATGDVADANERLAALFSSRSQYSSTRVLTYGTIVRFKEKNELGFKRYALCIMPVCDTLRLNQQYVKFPFWILEDNINKAGTQIGFSIEMNDGTMKTFLAGGKIRDKLWFDDIIVDPELQIAVADTDSKFEAQRFDIEWIGQIKPMHAQRIAQDVAQAISRVGLNEAEWLRKQSHG